jgi:hypothetical protein
VGAQIIPPEGLIERGCNDKKNKKISTNKI